MTKREQLIEVFSGAPEVLFTPSSVGRAVGLGETKTLDLLSEMEADGLVEHVDVGCGVTRHRWRWCGEDER
jgi:hypothetical protein